MSPDWVPPAGLLLVKGGGSEEKFVSKRFEPNDFNFQAY